MYRMLLSILLFLFMPPLFGTAQCPGGACPSPGIAMTWETHPNDPGRHYLYRGDTLIGGFDIEAAYFRPYDNATDRWGPVMFPPISPPLRGPRNYGVDMSRISGNHARINGREVNADDQIPNDTGFLRLTIIGTETECRPVLADLAANPNVTQGCVVQSYFPAHWSLRCGFRTGGSPTIYIQSPDGRVLHRQNDYQNGIAGLTKALRRASPTYDPSRDPDLRQDPVPPPVIPTNPDLDNLRGIISGIPIGTWLLIGIVLVGLLIMAQKRKGVSNAK